MNTFTRGFYNVMTEEGFFFPLCPERGQDAPDTTSDLSRFSAARPVGRRRPSELCLGKLSLQATDDGAVHGLTFPSTVECPQPRPEEKLLHMALAMPLSQLS